MKRKRDLQVLKTEEKILEALDQILESEGLDGITFKKVASKTGLTEMTVYRYFPSREKLLQGLWKKLGREIDPKIKMPDTRQEVVEQLPLLFQGFDQSSEKIESTFYTPEAKEFRLSVTDERRRSFKKIVHDTAPDLSPKETKQVAAVIQLLHSSFAWIALREQWGLGGKDSAKACQWAISILLKELEGKKKLEVRE